MRTRHVYTVLFLANLTKPCGVHWFYSVIRQDDSELQILKYVEENGSGIFCGTPAYRKCG
jgi:hypothetical protein